MSEPVVERYVRLGLQVGRHLDGIVDAYFGPPELSAAVEAEPPVDPNVLVADAETLVGELDDGWLRDQVIGLRTYAGVLAGESLSYSDEVEGCYGVRPRYTDEGVFSAAHEQLERLLPGDAPLAERYQEWQKSTRVPVDQAESVLEAVIEEARSWTRRLFGLPEGESVELEIVHDEPWMAFCAYRGNLRSHIEVNVDLPMSGIELLRLAIHETYSGHHAERCTKEQLLVRERGLLEETLVLIPTPQALIAEGIAELAPELLLDGEAGPSLAAVVRDAGIAFDLQHARGVERAAEPLGWVEVNAALMLYEQEAADEEVHAYLERWGLQTAQIASHVIRFLKAPTSRSYVMNYPAGRRLCRTYASREPERFRRLLSEQVRIGDLLAA